MGLLDAMQDDRFRRGVGRSLLDVGQSASNTIAQNVSAPVDGIAWLLRKAGLPIPSNPVGGSDWMAQKGLTRPVENGAPALVGEALGLLTPLVGTQQGTAAIGRQLVKWGENAASPNQLSKQAGQVYLGGKLTSNIDDANEYANLIKGHGKQFIPTIIQDRGGSVYVTVSKAPLTKAGEIAKNRNPIPIDFKARFADHPQYYGANISSDPITGNTALDAAREFEYRVLKGPIPEKSVSARFFPGGGEGSVTESVLQRGVPSVSGKTLVDKYQTETRPFSFLMDR
jgi:hypothetical protein